MNSSAYNFSQIKSIHLKVKNYIYVFALIIGLSIPVTLSTIILVLYFAKAPVEINGVSYDFGSYEAIQFYHYFWIIIICLFIVAIGITFLTYVFSKNVNQIYLSDDGFLDPFIYVEGSKKNMYISSSSCIIHTFRNNHVEVMTDLADIEKMKSEVLFWYELELQNIKIKQKDNKLVYRYSLNKNNVHFYKKYQLYFDSAGSLYKFKESITKTSRGNSTVSSLRSYYVLSLNTNIMVSIDPEIRSKIIQ